MTPEPDDETEQTEDAVRDELESVRDTVVSVNNSAVDAVNATTGLNASHPGIGLSDTHDALMQTYRDTVRAVDCVERTLDRFGDTHHSPTPRQIKSEHGERLEEQYDGPVLNLALLLLEHNRREWLHQKPGTNGAQAVERHGLTKNQRRWLNDLRDAWRAYDGD